MMHRSKVRTDKSRWVRSYPLRLELLEERLPPGDLVGSGLLGTAWLTSSSASSLQAGEPRQSTQMIHGRQSVYSDGSPSNLVAPVAETERPVAERSVGRLSWLVSEPVAGLEMTAGLLDNPLPPVENSRSKPRNFSQAEELSAGTGLTQSLADVGPQAGVLVSGTLGTATGSMVISSSGGLEGQARALTLFVQQSPVSLDPGVSGLLAGETGPSITGEFGVVAIVPFANGVSWPSDTPIAVEFTKPVDVATLSPATFAVFGRMSGMAQGSFAVSEDGLWVAFTPARLFLPGEAVEVMLTHDLAAADGTLLRAAGYAWTFWVQAGPGGNEFVEADRLDTGTGVRTYGGHTTDLNGDGYVDIAVVNEVAADLRVLMSNGDGTFGPVTSYRIRPGASPTVAGDFNRDGLTDIASSNYDDNSMSVLLGNGDGTFQESQTYRTGTTPAGIVAVDMDGDGAVELIVVNSVSNTLSLFQNNGDGTFQAQTTFFNVPGARLYGLAAADMNNDGIMDLVVGAQQTRRVYVLLGDGAGGFLQSANQNAGGGPWVLRAADVNGDGYADIEIANNGEGNMAILLGDGAGGLSAPVTYPAGSRPVSVSLGDLNGDGSLDIVISNFSSRDYAVFMNDGTGQFTRTSTLRARQSASCALIFDYNGDGLLDIGGVDELEDEIILFLNNG